MIAAVVPVKALAASKSRLFPELERAAIERLSLAMMGDVVEALSRVRGIAQVVVVTPDVAVARAAEAVGATALLRPDPGLNEAIEAAAEEVVATAGDGVLVVLGDVPAIVPSEVEALLAALDGPGVALAPASDGGTSALLRVPRDAIPARFGPDSAKLHREAAETTGVTYRELPLPSLAIDVDVNEDVDALLASATVGTRTRDALAALRAGSS